MKREADSKELNDRPFKKQKIDIWEQVQTKLESKTKNVDGHLIWHEDIVDNKYASLTIDGKTLKVYAWVYFLKKKSLDRPKDTKFRKLCNQDNCISHFLLQSLYLTSVTQMTEDDFKLAWKLINDGSEESDADPKNSELKTKCRLWLGNKSLAHYGMVKFMEKNYCCFETVYYVV